MGPKPDQAWHKRACTIRSVCSKTEEYRGSYPLPKMEVQPFARIRGYAQAPQYEVIRKSVTYNRKKDENGKNDISIGGSVRSNKAMALKDQLSQENDKSEEE